MAQVDSNNPNDPNNPNNPATAPNQVQQGANQPATTGGGGAVTATGSGNVTGQVTGTANPSQPFQNIASYLSANAPQSQALAGQVASTVSNPINQVGADITKAADTFTKSVNAGYTPENKDLTQAVSENPAYVVAENPENVTNFLGQLNDKYTGPTDFTTAPGYSDLQSEIANAQTMANNTNSESGIQTLLKSVEGPTTAGINKLDSLLLSANPDNAKTIQAAGAGAADLLPTLQNTTAAQNALAGQGSTNAAQAAQAALEALNTARGTESTNLTGEQKSIEDLVNQYNQSVGIVNPVVQNISSAISNFLAANPQITIGANGDPMADLKCRTWRLMPRRRITRKSPRLRNWAIPTSVTCRFPGRLPTKPRHLSSPRSSWTRSARLQASKKRCPTNLVELADRSIPPFSRFKPRRNRPMTPAAHMPQSPETLIFTEPRCRMF